jgi:hypothetical protein
MNKMLTITAILLALATPALANGNHNQPARTVKQTAQVTGSTFGNSNGAAGTQGKQRGNAFSAGGGLGVSTTGATAVGGGGLGGNIGGAVNVSSGSVSGAGSVAAVVGNGKASNQSYGNTAGSAGASLKSLTSKNSTQGW